MFKKATIPSVLLLAALTLMATCLPAAAQVGGKPNIVIMLTDDPRWDAVGFVQRELGAAGRFLFLKDSTPNIDKITASGVWFTMHSWSIHYARQAAPHF